MVKIKFKTAQSKFQTKFKTAYLNLKIKNGKIKTAKS